MQLKSKVRDPQDRLPNESPFIKYALCFILKALFISGHLKKRRETYYPIAQEIKAIRQ